MSHTLKRGSEEFPRAHTGFWSSATKHFVSFADTSWQTPEHAKTTATLNKVPAQGKKSEKGEERCGATSGRHPGRQHECMLIQSCVHLQMRRLGRSGMCGYSGRKYSNHKARTITWKILQRSLEQGSLISEVKTLKENLSKYHLRRVFRWFKIEICFSEHTVKCEVFNMNLIKFI